MTQTKTVLNGNNLWIKNRLKFPLENILNKNGHEVLHSEK